MKNALAAVTSWLKENKQEVTDEMIQSVLISNKTANLALGFKSELELGKFVMHVLPNSTAVKAGDGNYMVKLDWKKRPVMFILSVIPNLPQPVAEVFSDERVR